MASERKAVIHLEGWEGRRQVPCIVIGELANNYRVRLLQRSKLAGPNNWQNAGDVTFVPKRAVTFEGNTGND